MRLFLASEAKHPDTIKELSKYISGFSGKKIAYVPTAANGEEAYGAWKQGGTWQLVQALGAIVTPIQLEDYKNSSVINLFHNQDIIWFAGGQAGYLMYWVRRCGLDKTLPELLNTSLYVGSSAGAMITASTLDTSEIFCGDNELGASVIPGLGLVDFDFWPHYEENMLPEIKSHYQGKKLYLLKNGEEIIVENGKVRVIGEERIVRP